MFKQKLHTFNWTLWKSMSSLTYYQDVVKARFAFSFKFFWVFSLTLGFIITFSIMASLYGPISQFSAKFPDKVNQLYPQDLIVSIKNGEIITNVSEPFHIPLPSELQSNTNADLKNLLTIDTKSSSSDFPASKSLILITKNTAVMATWDGTSYQGIPLSELGDVTVDRNSFNAFMGKIGTWIKWLPVFLIVSMVLIFLVFLPLLKLVGLVFLTLLLFVFAKFLQVKLTFIKIFQIGLHALILPTFIQLLMVSFNLNVPIPFFNSILFLLYGLVILSSLKETTQQKPVPLIKLPDA